MNNKPFYTFTSVPVHLFFAYSIGITVPLVKISLHGCYLRPQLISRVTVYTRCLRTTQMPLDGASPQCFPGSTRRGVWARRRWPAPSTAAWGQRWWCPPWMLRGSCVSFKHTKRPGSWVHWPTSSQVRHWNTDILNTGSDVLSSAAIKGSLLFVIAGAEPVAVRNLKRSLLNAGPASGGESVVEQNGSTRHKRTRVAVLISGTGEFVFLFDLK